MLGLATLSLGAAHIAGSFEGPLASDEGLVCGARFTFVSWVAFLAAGAAVAAWLPGPVFESARTKAAVASALFVSFLVGYGVVWYQARWEWMAWAAEVCAWSGLGSAAAALTVVGKELQERASRKRGGAR